MNQNNKGFSLIELLIVIIIIAVLASITLLSLAPAQKAGRDARRISDLRQVQTILQLYYNKCGYYPGPAAPADQCPAATDATTGAFVLPDSPVWDIPGGLSDVLGRSGFLPVISDADGGNMIAFAPVAHAQLGNGAPLRYAIPKDPNAAKTYLYAVKGGYQTYVLQAQLETDSSALNSDVDGFVSGVECSDVYRMYCLGPSN